jgi:hypothetical protein
MAAESAADLFTSLAADLSGGNAASFLKRFDKTMSGYRDLEANVYALTGQASVASSIAILKDEGDAHRRTVTLDWVLEVTPITPANAVERRRETVTCRLELHGRKWTIAALDPIALFAPPKPNAAQRGVAGGRTWRTLQRAAAGFSPRNGALKCAAAR